MILRDVGRSAKISGLALGAVVLFAFMAPVSAFAQTAQPQPSAPSLDQMGITKLVWSTMAAVDHANQTGNYSVVRDLAAPGFQANNDAAKLGQIFANLRASGIDLSNTMLLAPTFRAQPRMVQADMMQLQGYFGLRPTGINFELLYQWTGGKWRLFGVGIAPAPMPTGQQATPQTPAPPKKK